MTQRQQIVDSLKSKLKTLEQVNTFWEDVTFLEWENTLDATTLPALIIYDKEDDIEQQSLEHRHELNIEIELHTKGDDAKPEFLRERMAEILRLFKTDTEHCDYINLQGTNLDTDTSEERVGYIQIKLTVQYFNGFWGM